MFSVCLLNDIEDQEHFRLHRKNILQESLNDSIWKTVGGDVSTRGSTSGYVFQIQGNTISWSSRKPQKLSISQ